jgi:hypothetical protein
MQGYTGNGKTLYMVMGGWRLHNFARDMKEKKMAKLKKINAFTQETTGGTRALYLVMVSRILLLFARDMKKTIAKRKKNNAGLHWQWQNT